MARARPTAYDPLPRSRHGRGRDHPARCAASYLPARLGKPACASEPKFGVALSLAAGDVNGTRHPRRHPGCAHRALALLLDGGSRPGAALPALARRNRRNWKDLLDRDCAGRRIPNYRVAGLPAERRFDRRAPSRFYPVPASARTGGPDRAPLAARQSGGAPGMTTDQPDETGAGRFAVAASAADNFAWLRTRLALERTLMAWVRTGIALIGFGFSIVEIFNRLAANPGVAPALLPEMPRYVGLTLIGAGVVALLISCWQYVLVSNYLWSLHFGPIAGLREGGGRTPALAIAIALAFVGLLAFIAVLLRVS